MKKEYLIFIGIIIALVIYSYVLYNFGIQHQKIVYMQGIKRDSTVTYHKAIPLKTKTINKVITLKTKVLPRDNKFEIPIADVELTLIKPKDKKPETSIADTLINNEPIGKDTLTVIRAKGIYEVDLKHNIEQVIKEVIVPVDVPFYKTFTAGIIFTIVAEVILILLIHL